MELSWLPQAADWSTALKAMAASPAVWDDAVALSRHRLNATQSNALDRTVRSATPRPADERLAAAPIRLAILGSCTTEHLHAAIRVAGLRRRLWIDIHEPAYGQYWRALAEPAELEAFAPTAILFAFDANHLAAGVKAGMSGEEAETALDAVAERVAQCWTMAAAFGRPIVQAMPLPVRPGLMGGNEHRLPGSPSTFVRRLCERLRTMADERGVDILALDTRAAHDGVAAWHDPELWFHAKAEIAPRAAPAYGELLVRLLAAQLGLSSKCLVLDLDNTLWGGAVGDLGVEGIELGQGGVAGEAFLAVQAYARDLSRRGVILAVCSKNDEANALEPFERHPEMVLKRSDIACFVANWEDKAANLRAIAQTLNIGLESLVLLDDNPFERALVRRELPMVAAPEVSDDPVTYPQVLEDAGYFEATRVTADDRGRAASYGANTERARAQGAATDVAGYLRSLELRLLWRPFDRLGLTRIVQLANKTNQFNLLTARYADADVTRIIDDPRRLGLQFRLVDRFGDNGTVALVAGALDDTGALRIDNWLMSCRVLGRGVENATLVVVAEQARRMGANRLVGAYRATAKNAMVRDLYPRLGFEPLDTHGDTQTYALDLSHVRPPDEAFITVVEEEAA